MRSCIDTPPTSKMLLSDKKKSIIAINVDGLPASVNNSASKYPNNMIAMEFVFSLICAKKTTTTQVTIVI